MTKTEFKYFTIVDYDAEAKYLSEMHGSGWKLIGVTFPGFYFFESCTPEEVAYQLDYNSEGREHKDEYVQMFADCGWEYITDFVGYSYFRKPADEVKGKEEIFCDDSSRLDMMKRIFLGRLSPLVAIFFLIIIPNLYRNNPTRLDNYVPQLWYIYLGGFFLCLLVFVKFGIDYYRLYRKTR